MPRRGAGLLAAVLLLAAAGCAPGRSLALTVTPTVSRFDEPLAIRVTGAEPGAAVVLSATSTDEEQRTWTSTATFTAGPDGVVDPAVQAPTRGSYLGTYGMGLVSSMLTPGLGAADGVFAWPAAGPADVTVAATADGRSSSTTVRRSRYDAAPTVRRFTVAADGFVGTYVEPAGASRGPAVLFLGGSEGGVPVFSADVLAARGIPTLAVGYFGAPGRPDRLQNIPIEYFEAPLRWLRAQASTDPDRLWIAGASRGSEAAALTAVHYPQLVRGLLDLTPSSVANCAYWLGQPTPCPGPGWTWRGEPVPYTAERNSTAPTDHPDAVIPVEKINGPVLALCGEQDLLWSSCAYSRAIMARLADRGVRHRRLLLAESGAGHAVNLMVPYQPHRFGDIRLPVNGVTPLANDQATARAWPQLLAFLQAG